MGQIRSGHIIALFSTQVFLMLGVVIGYHRYFSHKAFQTGRVFQFVLAWWSQSSLQKGVLWWASHHRDHHRYSDQPNDVHSALQDGFWYSHMGWIMSAQNNHTDYSKIKDFAKFPELVWLNKYHTVPPILMFITYFVVGGLPALMFSCFGAITLNWHITYTINSLAHLYGNKRYDTGDASRNNWFLAIITHGEGWHNNHHHYMHSARQGFFWYEYDVGYYIIRLLKFCGLIKKVREVPEAVRNQIMSVK